jgi:hypothetical protein
MRGRNAVDVAGEGIGGILAIGGDRRGIAEMFGVGATRETGRRGVRAVLIFGVARAGLRVSR